MAEIWEKEYLTFVQELLGNLAEGGVIREIELFEDEAGKPSLIMTPALPSEGYELVQFRFTVEHILEGTDQMRIMVSLFDGVPADRLAEAEKIVARVNEFMLLGNAAIFYDGGMIFFGHSFVFDRDMDVGAVTAILGKTLEIIMKTVPQIIEILVPVVNGTVTADALIAQGIDLIQ